MQHESPTEHLIAFARPPVRGRVKSRLAAVVGADAALALYRAFLADTVGLLGRCRRRHRTIELCLAGPWPPDAGFAPLPDDLTVTAQAEGDLGDRLDHALARSRAAGHRACVVIGSDAPTLSGARVDEAFATLDRDHDVAIAPADDGGYVLLGVRHVRTDRSPLLRGIPWSTPDVTATTLAQARAAGWSAACLATGFDVDDRSGLVRLRDALADETVAARAPATAAAMAALAASRPSTFEQNP